MLFTYIFVCICWIFFRADNIGTAFAVLKKIFVWDDGVQHIYSWLLPAIAVLVLEIAVSYFAGRKIKGAERYTINSHYIQLDLTKFWSLFFVILFAGLILSLAYTGENPFIYFQF